MFITHDTSAYWIFLFTIPAFHIYETKWHIVVITIFSGRLCLASTPQVIEILTNAEIHVEETPHTRDCNSDRQSEPKRNSFGLRIGWKLDRIVSIGLGTGRGRNRKTRLRLELCAQIEDNTSLFSKYMTFTGTITLYVHYTNIYTSLWRERIIIIIVTDWIMYISVDEWSPRCHITPTLCQSSRILDHFKKPTTFSEVNTYDHWSWAKICSP